MTLYCLACGELHAYEGPAPTHDDWYCPDCLPGHLAWRSRQDPSRFTEEFQQRREHWKMIDRENERYD